MERDLDAFIRQLAIERGLSEAYQRSVRQTLDALGDWMDGKKLSLADLGTDELAEFLKVRKQEGLNAASLRILTVHLKIFFRWMASEKRLPMDPAEPLLAPRPDQTLPETLHLNEVIKLLESIDVTKELGRRDKAILELFYSSGLRLSELCGLRLEMADLEEGFLRVTGKGNKTRIVRIGGQALEAVRNYMSNERPNLVTPKTSSHLFISVRGGPLSPDRVRQIVKQRAEQAGIESNIYPHLLRHSFATHLLAGGTDIRTIQTLLGHVNVKTTMIYTHVVKTGPLGVTSPADRLNRKTAPPSEEKKSEPDHAPRPATRDTALLVLPIEPKRKAPPPPEIAKASEPLPLPSGWRRAVSELAMLLLTLAAHRFR